VPATEAPSLHARSESIDFLRPVRPRPSMAIASRITTRALSTLAAVKLPEAAVAAAGTEAVTLPSSAQQLTGAGVPICRSWQPSQNTTYDPASEKERPKIPWICARRADCQDSHLPAFRIHEGYSSPRFRWTFESRPVVLLPLREKRTWTYGCRFQPHVLDQLPREKETVSYRKLKR
jgi:hypothetical protein